MHDPFIQALIDLHRELPRKGPGSDALSCDLMAQVRSLLPDNPRMADMGCGNGHTAFQLIATLGGSVTAVDFAEPFIDELKARLQGEPITPVLGEMLEPGLAPGSLDLIWSEGAAFAVGVENALKTWLPLLKPGGILVYSEAVWFTPAPGGKIAEFWAQNYPEIRSVGDNITRAEALGYRFLAARALPRQAWWESYFNPMRARLDQLEPTLEPNSLMAQVVVSARREQEMFRLYGDQYGYAFFVLQKP